MHKLQLLRFPLLLLAILVLSATIDLKAQNTKPSYQPDKHLLSIDYLQQSYKGVNRYMTFHDHDPNVVISSLYHQHLYYFPFDPATEKFTRLQINGQYQLNKRAAVQITIPYVNNRRISDQTTANNKASGLGDIQLGGYYHFFDSHLFQKTPTNRHLLVIGGLLSLPSGKFANFDALNELEPHMQVGKGAYSGQFMSIYYFQKQQHQVQSSITFNYHLPNQYEYVFGNEIAVHTNYTHELSFNEFTLKPSFGFFFKYRIADIMQNRSIVEDTAGWNVQLNGEITLQWQQVFMKIQYDLPTLQRNKGLQPLLNHLFQCSLGFEFNQPSKSLQKYPF